MPFFFLLGGAALIGGFIATVGAGTANKTVPQAPVRPSEGGLDETIIDVVKWPLLIAGTIVAVKYGNKLVRKL